jgi:hypothetical protein
LTTQLVNLTRCFSAVLSQLLRWRLWPTRAARIYPGPELASFTAVRQGHVPGAPPGLESDYYAHVSFERRKAPASQQLPSGPVFIIACE